VNTNELVNYYANLLVLQYLGKPKAYATIQTLVTPVVMPQVTTQEIAFLPVPDAGAFTLVYGLLSTASIAWNASTPTIQSALQAVTGLGAVTVAGSIASGTLVVTFTGVAPVAAILTVGVNTLTNTSNPVVPVVTETDETLPIAVQNAFNVIAPDLAVGVQLDVIGKYVGASRTNQGFTQQITLSDGDYTTLIQISIIENNAGSSTAEIVGLLNQFFPAEIFLFDRKDMTFDYYITTAIGSQDLLQVFITEGKLPRPMGVRIRLIIYAPIVSTFFGFRTYQAPGYNVTPFNSYAAYVLTWPFLSYVNAIII